MWCWASYLTTLGLFPHFGSRDKPHRVVVRVRWNSTFSAKQSTCDHAEINSPKHLISLIAIFNTHEDQERNQGMRGSAQASVLIQSQGEKRFRCSWGMWLCQHKPAVFRFDPCGDPGAHILPFVSLSPFPFFFLPCLCNDYSWLSDGLGTELFSLENREKSPMEFFFKALNHILVWFLSIRRPTADSWEEQGNGIVSPCGYLSCLPCRLRSSKVSPVPHYCSGSVFGSRSGS